MNHNKFKSIIAFLFPAIVIFGNYSFGEIRLFGLVLTIGRVCIPLICLYLLADNYRNKEKIIPASRSREGSLLMMLTVWVIYAAITIVLMPYADFHSGVLEMMALILGAMIVISMVILCREGNWYILMTGLRVALLITLVIGVYEIVTGNHLSTSRFCDPEFISLYKDRIGDGGNTAKWYVATSIFYNENDFSAMIAVFAPMLVCGQRPGKRWIWGLDLFIVCLCFAILYFNNAFICFIAFILGLIITILFGFSNVKDRLIILGALAVSRVSVYFLEKVLKLRLGWSATVLAQVDASLNGTGSMWYRINTYKLTITETFLTSKGVGFGAGSFTKYFGQFAGSYNIMTNPHCFWFEIMSEYGVVILLLFAGVLLFIMSGLIIRFRQSKDARCIAIAASGVSLIFASVAPSSYLTGTYYWIPIALAVYLADQNEALTANKSNCQ